MDEGIEQWKGDTMNINELTYKSITFKFWSTEEEYRQIVDAMEKEMYNELDQEYKVLLDTYHL